MDSGVETPAGSAPADDAAGALDRLRAALNRLADEGTHTAVARAVHELRRHPDRQTPAQRVLLQAIDDLNDTADESAHDAVGDSSDALAEIADEASQRELMAEAEPRGEAERSSAVSAAPNGPAAAESTPATTETQADVELDPAPDAAVASTTDVARPVAEGWDDSDDLAKELDALLNDAESESAPETAEQTIALPPDHAPSDDSDDLAKELDALLNDAESEPAPEAAAPSHPEGFGRSPDDDSDDPTVAFDALLNATDDAPNPAQAADADESRASADAQSDPGENAATNNAPADEAPSDDDELELDGAFLDVSDLPESADSAPSRDEAANAEHEATELDALSDEPRAIDERRGPDEPDAELVASASKTEEPESATQPDSSSAANGPANENRGEFDNELADDLEKLLEGEFNSVDVVVNGEKDESHAVDEPNEAAPPSAEANSAAAGAMATPELNPSDDALDLDAMPELAPDDPEASRETPTADALPGETAGIEELLGAEDDRTREAPSPAADVTAEEFAALQDEGEIISLETESNIEPRHEAPTAPADNAAALQAASPEHAPATPDDVRGEEDFSEEELEAIDGSAAFDDDTVVKEKDAHALAASGQDLKDADGPSAMEIEASGAARSRSGPERLAIAALSVINRPFELLPPGVRRVVEWIALTLVFWAPIVWAIAIMMRD